MIRTAILAAVVFCAPGNCQRLSPAPVRAKIEDLRLPAANTLPEVESVQQVIFSGSVSGIPRNEGVDRITAPPLTVVLRQTFAVWDRASGAMYHDGAVGGGAKLLAPPALTWEPGRATIVTDSDVARMEVEQTALRNPQGFVVKVTLRNTSGIARRLALASVQHPTPLRPKQWTYAAQWARTAEPPAPARAEGSVVAHTAPDGVVAFAMDGAASVAAGNTKAAIALAQAGKRGGTGPCTALYRDVDLRPGEARTLHLVFAFSEQAARELMRDPDAAAASARQLMQAEIDAHLARLPALEHPDARVVRFYRHAALQLLYSRWKVGRTFILDPWYPTLGLDSGGLNAYAWDFGYSAVPLSLLDPAGMRAMLVALLSAPLTTHYSIEPVGGEGTGPFYAYSPYAFTWAVDCYIRATGDRTILAEKMKGKTVLEWLIELARFGEKDGNGLVDYGDDHNLLEIKTTGKGPGYIHQVPSPNGERAWVYDTLADILNEEGEAHAALATRFRASAGAVRRAVNDVLWLEDAGWYGTRQLDGNVVPVWSIQIFDLLRIPGLVPRARAERLIAHLNDDEFLGPWGMRSLSRKDRLWDWRDHDWAGPMSFIGDAPQAVADLYAAGFPEQAWRVWESILWWPEHLAVYPQGIANDDFSKMYPESARFGGRASAGRTNEVSGCVGVEAIVRGLFGVAPERDGAIGFTSGHRPSEGRMALRYPFRGKTWTVTLGRDAIDVARDDGFGAALWREDGALRVRETAAAIEIRASARTGGAGRLAVSTAYLLSRLQVKSARDLVVEVNGARARTRTSGTSLVLQLSKLAGSGEEIRITAGKR